MSTIEEENQNETLQPQEQKTDEQKMAKGGNKALIPGLIILVLVIVVAAVYYKSNKNKTASSELMNESSQVSPAQTEVNNESDIMQSEEGVTDIAVEGSEFSYNPSSISLAKGEVVRLTFNNVGTVPHNLVIDELGVMTKTIGPGESDTVEFTASESGSYTFYCSVDSHRARGMEGEVMVE